MSSIKYWLGPLGNKELSIYFDKEGANIFIDKILHPYEKYHFFKIPAKNIKNEKEIESEIEIKLALNESMESIKIDEKKLIINLTAESIDYAIFKIKEFIKTNDFFPSEYYSIPQSEKKYSVQIYFTNSIPMSIESYLNKIH